MVASDDRRSIRPSVSNGDPTGEREKRAASVRTTRTISSLSIRLAHYKRRIFVGSPARRPDSSGLPGAGGLAADRALLQAPTSASAPTTSGCLQHSLNPSPNPSSTARPGGRCPCFRSSRWYGGPGARLGGTVFRSVRSSSRPRSELTPIARLDRLKSEPFYEPGRPRSVRPSSESPVAYRESVSLPGYLGTASRRAGFDRSHRYAESQPNCMVPPHALALVVRGGAAALRPCRLAKSRDPSAATDDRQTWPATCSRPSGEPASGRC